SAWYAHLSSPASVTFCRCSAPSDELTGPLNVGYIRRANGNEIVPPHKNRRFEETPNAFADGV
ncbi:MAG TPA: hypothetical protein VNO32_03075, partial [Candidatus Acidoferrum sp.]|nr:hypothetical protein [Candidatus Acidoferrum sp.]